MLGRLGGGAAETRGLGLQCLPGEAHGLQVAPVLKRDSSVDLVDEVVKDYLQTRCNRFLFFTNTVINRPGVAGAVPRLNITDDLKKRAEY